jgi:hypothetical protein
MVTKQALSPGGQRASAKGRKDYLFRNPVATQKSNDSFFANYQSDAYSFFINNMRIAL